MRIVSDITGKSYTTVDECLAAEEAFVEKQKKVEAEKKALAEQRKERAAEVTKAYENAKAAEKQYYELRNAFVKDYGYYHTTYTDSEAKPFIVDFAELFNSIFHN